MDISKELAQIQALAKSESENINRPASQFSLPMTKAEKRKTLKYQQIKNTLDNISGITANAKAGSMANRLYNLNEFADSNYEDYNVYPTRAISKDLLDKERAKNQSWTEQAGHAITQMGLGEVAIGIPLAFSNLIDTARDFMNKNDPDFQANPVSEYLEELKEDVKNKYAIYRENPEESWDMSDFGWWADNSVSVATTLSLLLPSKWVTSGLGLLSKIGRVGSKTTKAVAALTKGLTGSEKSVESLAKAIDVGTKLGTTALFSRTMENYQEGREVYKQQYDESLNTLNSMTAAEKQKFLRNNPDYANMTNDEIAKQIASEGANKTFWNDYAMLGFDMLQFKALGDIWKGGKNINPTRALQSANKRAIAQLAGEDALAEELNKGVISKLLDYGTYNLKHPFQNALFAELSEGIEEGYQGMMSYYGEDYVKHKLDPTYSPRTFSSMLTDGSIWEQAFWGWIGGVVFQGAGKAYNAGKKKLAKEYYKRIKHMSDEDINARFVSNEKQRQEEIEHRIAKLNAIKTQFDAINQGFHPDETQFEVDANGELILEDGKPKRKTITAAEGNILKIQLWQDALTDLTLDAADAGNYNLLKEYIKSTNFDKWARENGMSISFTGRDNYQDQALSYMDDVYDRHTTNYYNVINNIDSDNIYIAKLMARDITRQSLLYDSLDRQIKDIDAEISSLNTGNIDLEFAKEAVRAKYVSRQIAALEYNKKMFREQYTDGIISKSALDKYLEIQDSNIASLHKYLNKNTTFGQTEGITGNLSDLIIDMEKYMKKFTNVDSLGNINSDILDKLYGIAYAESSKQIISDITPIGVANNTTIAGDVVNTNLYDNLYKEYSRTFDTVTRNKVRNAFNKLHKYIEDAKDREQALADLMDNNIEDEELQDALDIVQLGFAHNAEGVESIVSGQRLLDELKRFVRIADKEDADREAAAKVNTTNGKAGEENTAMMNQVREEEAAAKQAEETAEDVEEESEIEETPSDIAEESDVDNNIQKETIVDETIAAEPARTITPVEDVPQYTAPTQIEAEDYAQFNVITNIDKVTNATTTTLMIMYKKREPVLLNALENPDDENILNELSTYVAEQLIEKGYEKDFVNKNIRYCTDKGLRSFSAMVSRINPTLSQQFVLLAYQIGAFNSEEFESSIANNYYEMPETVDAFMNIYVQEKNIRPYRKKVTINGEQTTVEKYIIDIPAMYNYLLSDKILEELGYDTVKQIYMNLYNYILNNAQNNNNYSFTGIRYLQNKLNQFDSFALELTKKQTKENASTIEYIHAVLSGLGKRQDKINRIIEIIDNNENVQIVEDTHNGNLDIIDPTKSEKDDNRKLVYFPKVTLARTNSTAIRLERQIEGFAYEVQNGKVSPEMINFFKEIISNRENEDAAKLFDIISRLYAEEVPSADILSNLTQEEILDIINNKFLQDYIIRVPKAVKAESFKDILTERISRFGEKGKVGIVVESNFYQFAEEDDGESGPDYLEPDGTLTRKGAAHILSKIYNIIVPARRTNLLGEDLFAEDKLNESIDNWETVEVAKLTRTKELQEAYADKKQINPKLLIDIEERQEFIKGEQPIALLPYDANVHEFFVMDKTGEIKTENNKDSIYSAIMFNKPTIGFIIRDSKGNPRISAFNRGRMLTDNPKITALVKAEIIDTINKFRNGELPFENKDDDKADTVVKRLSNLIGYGTDSQGNHSTLFLGFNVDYNGSGHICLRYPGTSGETSKNLIVFHKFRHNTNVLGTGITYNPVNGNPSKNSNDFTDEDVNEIADEIIANLSFNKTFFAINYKSLENTDESISKYLRKENNKIVLEIAGQRFEYDSFGHMALAENMYTTSQGVVDGKFFSRKIKPNNIYLDTEISDEITTPKEEYRTAYDILKEQLSTSEKRQTPIKTRQLLTAAGYKEEDIDRLLKFNEYEQLLADDVYVVISDKNDATYEARRDRIKITSRGAEKIKKNHNELFRLLTHENIHRNFEQQYVIRDKNGIRLTTKGKQIANELLDTYKKFKEYIDKEHVDKKPTLIEEFANKFDERFVKDIKDEEDIMLFATEWLAESLTRKDLIDYLNTHNYGEEEIIIDQEKPKTLFQKIVELLMDFFGIDINTNNRSILARQYQILAEQSNNISKGKETEFIESKTYTEETTQSKDVEETKPVEESTSLEEASNEDYDALTEEDDDDSTEYASSIDLDYENAETTLNSLPKRITVEEAVKRNNGHSLDLTPTGKESILYKTLLEEFNGDEQQALEAKAKVYGDGFINWFGDWTNNPSEASKVVDENGEPLVVYRGDKTNKSEFKGHVVSYNVTGIYFTGLRPFAERYAKPSFKNGNIAGDVYPVFINSKNPYEGKNSDIDKWNNGELNEYDSWLYGNFPKGNGELVIRDSNQAKSAINNNGDFSTTKNEIYESSIELDADIAFSNPNQTIDGGLFVGDIQETIDNAPTAIKPYLAEMIDSGEITYLCR